MLWLAIICIFTSSVASITITIPQEVERGRRVLVGWKRTQEEPAEFFFQVRTVEGVVGPPIEIGRPPPEPPSTSVPNPEPSPLPLQGTVMAVFREAGSFILETVDSTTFAVLGSSTIFQVLETASRPEVGPEPSATDIVTVTITTPIPSQSKSHVSSNLRSSTSVTLDSRTQGPSSSGSVHHDSSSSTRSSTTSISIQPSRTAPTTSSSTTTRTSTSSSNMVPSPPTPSSTEPATTPADNSSGTQRQGLNIAMIVGLVVGGVVLIVLLRWLFVWLWRRSTYAATHSTPYRAIQYYTAHTFPQFRRHPSDPLPPNAAGTDTHPEYAQSKERLHPEYFSNAAPTSSSSNLLADTRDPDPIRHRIAELEQANVQQSTEMAQLLVENELWRGQHLRALGFQEHPPPHYEGTSAAGGSETTQGPTNPPG